MFIDVVVTVVGFSEAGSGWMVGANQEYLCSQEVLAGCTNEPGCTSQAKHPKHPLPSQRCTDREVSQKSCLEDPGYSPV